jgi:hypothetical protein
MSLTTATAALAVACLFLGCDAPDTESQTAQQAEDSEWIQLFNGTDLSGWDTYLGPLVEVDSTDSSRTEIPGSELGLNNDPNDDFSVAEEDGTPVIRISGVTGGGISTVDSTYGNYHFRMELKWGEGNPWLRSRGDSGLLYHAGGEQGADQGYWLRSHEYQIMPTSYGDYIAIEGCVGDVPSRQADDGDDWVYDPNGELRAFTRVQELTDTGGSIDRLPSFEDPDSDWITLELYTLGETAVHVVDGEVVLVLHNSRLHENGQTNPLTEGKIQIQSEGSEVFLRNIELRSISELPPDLLEGHTMAAAG